MSDDLEIYFEEESLEVEFVEDAPLTVQFVDGDTTEITFLEPEDLTVELVESEPLEVTFDGAVFGTGTGNSYFPSGW